MKAQFHTLSEGWQALLFLTGTLLLAPVTYIALRVLIVALQFAVFNPALHLWLAAILTGWWLTRRTNSIAISTVHRLLGSALLGLTLAWAFGLILSAIASPVGLDSVKSVEKFALDTKESLDEAATAKHLGSACILILVLWWLNDRFPRLRLLSRFIWLKSLAGQLSLVLLTATTFTFVSALPVDGLVKQWRDQNLEIYRALIRQANEHDARFLTAVAIQQQLTKLDTPTCQQYRVIFGVITDNAEFLRSLAIEFGETDASALLREARKVVPPETVPAVGSIDEEFGPAPVSWTQMAQQEELLRVAKVRESDAKNAAKNAMKAVSEMFATLIDGGIDSKFHGVAGEYMKSLITDLAGNYFEDRIYLPLALKLSARDAPDTNISVLVVLTYTRASHIKEFRRGVSNRALWLRPLADIAAEHRRVYELETEMGLRDREGRLKPIEALRPPK
jgi:hypothetical protein